MKIYALVPDAFGGYGGIAVYNRDLLTAFSQHPDLSQLIAVPRVIPRPMEPTPGRLQYRTKAAGGVLAFLGALVRDLPEIARSDLIYCGHLNLAPIAWLLGAVFRTPVLGALYGIEAWTPAQRPLSAFLFRFMTHYFSISVYTRDRFRQWSRVPEERITLLPNAIHLEKYGPGPKRNPVAERYGLPGRRVLLTVGRLVSHDRAKGFDEILDVLPRLVRWDPSLVYVIAGDGAYRAALETKAESLGVAQHVVFTGFISEADKADLYRSADLYVMPSRGEGFGFVFLEAMACGVPVIASAVDGSRDAVRDGMLGPMVHPDDAEGLVLAIQKGLEAPRGVPPGLDYFGFPHFVQRANDLVDQLVTR